jgi:hypothetical protein
MVASVQKSLGNIILYKTAPLMPCIIRNVPAVKSEEKLFQIIA